MQLYEWIFSVNTDLSTTATGVCVSGTRVGVGVTVRAGLMSLFYSCWRSVIGLSAVLTKVGGD